jgi:hypothetical protein
MLPRRMARRRSIAVVLGALAVAIAVAACGEEKVSVPKGTPEHAGAQGSATKVRDRERVDGPNFNQRKETYDQVLYAIRNGGFSGAIMPENIVTGPQAQAIARFLQKYSGKDAKNPPAPQSSG